MKLNLGDQENQLILTSELFTLLIGKLIYTKQIKDEEKYDFFENIIEQRFFFYCCELLRLSTCKIKHCNEFINDDFSKTENHGTVFLKGAVNGLKSFFDYYHNADRIINYYISFFFRII